jgi:hypothetical protein
LLQKDAFPVKWGEGVRFDRLKITLKRVKVKAEDDDSRDTGLPAVPAI